MRRAIAMAAAVLAGGPAFGQAQDDSSPLGTRPKIPYVVPAVPQVKPPTPYVFRIRDRATAERAAGGPRAKNYWALQRIAREKAERAAATRGPSVARPTLPGRTSDGPIPGTQVRATGIAPVDQRSIRAAFAQQYGGFVTYGGRTEPLASNTFCTDGLAALPSGAVITVTDQGVGTRTYEVIEKSDRGIRYKSYRRIDDNRLPLRLRDGERSCCDRPTLVYGVDTITPASLTSATAAPVYEPREPATDLERACVLLAAERPDDAVAALRAHLEAEPDDVRAMRLLGLALIESGRVDDGVAMVMLAYRTDPMLPHTPAEGELFGPDRLHRVLILAVRQANRADLASGWVTVAAVMQAEGRPAQARRMVERARALGLDASLASEFASALTPGG